MKKFVIILISLFNVYVVIAQNYDYRIESFEGNEWATTGQTSVTNNRGTWTTNKNIQDKTYAHTGTYSYHLANKVGITFPKLTEGAGALVYYAYDKNRRVNVSVSENGTDWTVVESYKETTDWTKHVVEIFNKNVQYVKISSESNKDFYIDDIIVTKMDGKDADGNEYMTRLSLPYFKNDFENTNNYPADKTEAASEKTFNVKGEGEWKYYQAYKATNEQYIVDGSGHNLRMLKGGSYVITPVLSQGVVKVFFNEGRASKKVQIYTSKDAGATWTFIKTLETQKENLLTFQNKEINRIKIANEGTSGDCDLDNIIVYAYPQGTPATVLTGEISEIGSSKAVVSGQVTNVGDKAILERGVCWSLTETPVFTDNIVKAETDDFAVTLTNIPAKTKIYCRAYAMSLAGVGYGDVKSFTTLAATAPIVKTDEVAEDPSLTDETNVYVHTGGTVLDNGGAEIIETGVCYSTSENPDIESEKIEGHSKSSSFVVDIPLQPNTQYYFRAYATNGVGTGYGEQKSFKTGEIIKPTYQHNVYYVSPEGSDVGADGTITKPYYHLSSVVNKTVPGDTIYMIAGTYNYTERINVNKSGLRNSGMITIAGKGGRAILDFSAMADEDNNQGMRLTGSYWHLYNLDFVGAGDNGLLIERNKPSGGNYNSIKDSISQGHDNLIECCNFYRNRDTGLQIKNLGSYNKIVNCDSYFNRDSSDGDADGFAVKISHGDGNYFYGCRAWNNSDDGWDGFIKSDGGFPDDITTTFEECWAFNNGFLETGIEGEGNGNGFKMGSDQGRNNNILNRCLAFNNLQKNFDQNHNTGNMILNNCTSYSAKYTSNSSHYTYRLDEAVASNHEIILHNSVAISDGISDRKKSEYAPYSVTTATLVTSDLNTLPADYKTIDPTAAFGDRKADGSLPEMDFMHIAAGNTKLVDTGSEVIPYEGESRWSVGIKYNGSAPDLGCFETDSPTAIGNVKVTSKDSNLQLVQCKNGMIIISNPQISTLSTQPSTLYCYSLSGKLLGKKTFVGDTTSFHLNTTERNVILKVGNKQIKVSISQ